MYNGIGLCTPRGSGTNGYVQRNLACVYSSNKKILSTGDQINALSFRKSNSDIDEHNRKREIELNCMKFQAVLENQGYSADEIDRRVSAYRQKILEFKKSQK